MPNTFWEKERGRGKEKGITLDIVEYVTLTLASCISIEGQNHIILISEITLGRVLNGELYAQRLQFN